MLKYMQESLVEKWEGVIIDWRQLSRPFMLMFDRTIHVCTNSLVTMITPHWGCAVCVLTSHINCAVSVGNIDSVDVPTSALPL